MGEIILLLIVVVLAIKGDYTLFYIFGGVFVIAVIVSLFSKGPAPKKLPPSPACGLTIRTTLPKMNMNAGSAASGLAAP